MAVARPEGAAVPEGQPTHRRPSALTVGLFVVLALIGVAVLFLDLDDLLRTALQADWYYAGIALGASTVAYVFWALAWAYMSQLLGINAPARPVLAVGFIAATLNNVVALGGVAGHSARVSILRDRGVRSGDVLAASTFHAYMTNAVLMLLLPVGVLQALLTVGLPTAAFVPLASLTALALLVAVGSTWLIFHARVRRALVRRLARLLSKVFRSGSFAHGLQDFEQTLERAASLVRRRRWALLGALGLDALAWLSTAVTLWFCFEAVGEPLTVGVLLTGMTIGVAAGLASAVPAGIGVMEASMAGVFTLLGVSLNVAILAGLLFRVTYHVIPFAVAMVFYARMLRVSVGSLVRSGRIAGSAETDGAAAVQPAEAAPAAGASPLVQRRP